MNKFETKYLTIKDVKRKTERKSSGLIAKLKEFMDKKEEAIQFDFTSEKDKASAYYSIRSYIKSHCYPETYHVMSRGNSVYVINLCRDEAYN